MDVAITHPLQKANLPVAREVVGAAAVRYAIQVKDKRYKKSVEQGDYQREFLPVVADVHGAWSPRALEFFPSRAAKRRPEITTTRWF